MNKTHTIIFRLSIIAFTIAILFACNSKAKEQEKKEVSDSTASVSTVSEKEEVKQPSPKAFFIDGSGNTISLASLKGKVVFINFWATWCPPCIEELPSIAKLKEGFKDRKDIVFLMVDVDGDYEKSKAFMDKNKYDLTVYTPDGDIPAEFLGNAIPTTVIIDKKGELVARAEGGRDYSDPKTIKALTDLLNE